MPVYTGAMEYHKLVRDYIPDRIQEKGERAVFHIADKEEYQEKLREKLSEEVAEYLESQSTEELADILEVVYALAQLAGDTPAIVEKLRAEKAEKRGAFTKRIILDES